MLCCSCKRSPAREGQRNCLSCHAAFMRTWRKSHPMNDIQKMKDSCRSYARSYLVRGKLQKEPCVKCGDQDSEMHHSDYSKPLLVSWMCRQCHLDHHREIACVL